MTECRICLDADNEEFGNLISPCKCSGSQKYVHEQCLQRWRDENLNRHNRDNCEICKTDFHIIQDHQKEIYIMRIYNGPWTPPMLYYLVSSTMFAICLDQYDMYSNYITIHLITPDSMNKKLLYLLQTDRIYSILYYTSFSSYLFAITYLTMFGFCTICCIYRFLRYWKYYFPLFLSHYLLCSNFIYFLYFGLYTDSLDITINILLLFTLFYLPLINYSHTIHNNIVHKMNLEDNNERVLSTEMSIV